MRQWINLFENNGFAEIVKAMSAHDAPSAIPGLGYTIDGDTYEITDEHVAEMRERIEGILRRNPTVYRYVLLRPADLAQFLDGPLGTFWCYDWEINLDALTGWDSAPQDAELYRLTATVRIDDVDMARTVVQNLAVPWENEITIVAGSALVLRGCDLLPNVDERARPVSQPIPRKSFIA